MNSAAAVGCRPPFTASQWEELEHQALIYKYMITGAPVPPELVLPIRRSLASLPSRLYHHPTLGYCTYYGKKLDPEPGRCRRTDGKKWRCSKDAHPDSKYCERHMHRSRSRSRKPVESQALSQSQSTSSTVTSHTPVAGGGVSGSRSIAGSFQHNPLQSSVVGGSSLLGSCNAGGSASQLNIDLGSYAMSNKEYRYLCGLKSQADGHSFFSEGSGSARGLGMDSSLESSWRQIPSRVSSFPLSRERTNSVMPSSYPQLQSVQDLEQAAISSLSKPQQQYSFFGCDFASSETGKVESHSLHPFFDEWPKTKDSWTGLEDERSNRNSFSTTQLSISIPMASSDFSTTSSRSPTDDC